MHNSLKLSHTDTGICFDTAGDSLCLVPGATGGGICSNAMGNNICSKVVGNGSFSVHGATCNGILLCYERRLLIRRRCHSQRHLTLRYGRRPGAAAHGQRHML